MKLLALKIFLLLSIYSTAQLEAIFDVKRFDAPSGPFIETYLNVYSHSIAYVQTDSTNESYAIEVVQLLKQGEEIIDFKKYVLTRPEAEKEYNDILDQQRFQVKSGEKYSLELELKDLNNDSIPVQKHQQDVEVNFSDETVNVSDIEFLDSFWKTDKELATTKSGYNMIPLVSTYFSPDFEKIAYYFEVYNTNKVFGDSNRFILHHFIENYETGNIAGNFSKMNRMKSSEVIPVLNVFEISSLPTGNYNMVVQIRDRENQLVAEQRTRFQRLNLLNDINTDHLKDVSIGGTFMERINKDSIDEFIYCLRPISTPIEKKIVDNQLDELDEQIKMQFFYSFWYNRNVQEPEREWLRYKRQVRLVDAMFGTQVKNGYETDRGRIFLKYGAPNTVDDKPHQPSTYPYQIWHYYKVGKFNNKRFVFYMPDLVTNEYEMLHSDLPGEINNHDWRRDLNKRNTQGGNLDDTDINSQWGNNTNVIFGNP